MSSNDNTNLKRKSTDSPTESTSPATKHIKLENGTGTPSAVAMNGQNQNPPVAGGPPTAAGQQQQPGARPLQSAPITQTIQMVNAILSQNIGMSSDQKEKYRAGIMSLQRVVQSEPPGSEKHQQAQTKIDQIVAHLRGLAARQQQQQQNVQPPPVDRSVNPLSAASRWIPPPNIPPQDADKWRAEIAQKLQAIGLKLQTHKQTLHDLQTADRSGMTPEQQQDTNKRMAEAQQQIQQWKEVLQKFSAQQKALQQAKQQVPPQVASQRPPGAPQQPPQAPQIQQQQQQPQPVPMAQSQSQGGVVQQQQQVRPQGTPQQQPAIVNRPVQQTPTPQAVPMQQQPSQQQQIQQQQQQQMGQPGGVPPRVSTPGIEVGRSGTPANINNHLHNINQQRQLQQAQAQAQNIQMQQHQQQQQTQMSPNTPGQTPAQALLPGQPRPLQQQQHPPPSTPITQGPINTPTTIPATPIHPGNQTPLTATAQGIPLQQQQQRIQPGQQIPIQPGQLPPQHPINMHRDNAAGSQKMPIPPTLTVNTPVATQMPPSRPTLTGGANMPTNHVMGTPGLIKQPQFRFDEDGGYGLLSKRKLEELVKQIDPDEKLDPDVEESVLELVDEFIDTIASTACKMAKLRGSDTLDIKDIQIILERNWNIRIPGFSADEIRTVRKFNPSSQYHHKMSALQAQKQLAQSGKDGP